MGISGNKHSGNIDADLLGSTHTHDFALLKRPKDATATGVVVGPDGWIATSYFNIAGELRQQLADVLDRLNRLEKGE